MTNCEFLQLRRDIASRILAATLTHTTGLISCDELAVSSMKAAHALAVIILDIEEVENIGISARLQKGVSVEKAWQLEVKASCDELKNTQVQFANKEQ